MAGRETGNSRAICPAGNAPRRSSSSTARRVGSASAWKVAPVEYVAERLRIIGNYMVPHLSCQPPPPALLIPANPIPVGISFPPTSRHTHVPCPRTTLAVVILNPAFCGEGSQPSDHDWCLPSAGTILSAFSPQIHRIGGEL